MESRLNFENDYCEGAHPKILEALIASNMEQTMGYGSDPYTESAEKKIRRACQCENAEIRLLVGGTQTNTTVIDSLLHNYEGVVCAETGHIAVHESGAVEAFGHKVLPLPARQGKLMPDVLRSYLRDFWADENHEHMVLPGMVYLSHPTEYGTLYTLSELQELYRICQDYEIPLYVDGARLGYGLASPETDVDLPALAKVTDVFSIGGTKVGALLGEAVVFTKKMPSHFLTTVKRHGALLAKGRVLGIQFDTLFTDDLYMENSRHAIAMAGLLKQGLEQRGMKFYLDSPTNQQFVVLENNFLQQLHRHIAFSIWEKVDEEHTAVRFCTSWATKEENIRKLFEVMDSIVL